MLLTVRRYKGYQVNINHLWSTYIRVRLMLMADAVRVNYAINDEHDSTLDFLPLNDRFC